MKRLNQIILVLTFVSFSWLAMQVVHELGHVIGAYLTHAEVTKIVLHPFTLSRTDLGHNPHPLVVVWAGPIIGAVLPLIIFLVARTWRALDLFLFRWFSGFCLIANGVYIAFGPSGGALDTGVMIQYGSQRWIMVIFGILTCPLGLYLWHRQGEDFGLGKAEGRVSQKATIVSAVLLIAVAGLEFIFNSR